MPKSKGRSKARASRARATQSAQRASEAKKVSYRMYRFRRVAGWSLVALGVIVGVSHRMTHLQLWRFASQGVMDIVAGYPMAALLGVGGAIVLTKA